MLIFLFAGVILHPPLYSEIEKPNPAQGGVLLTLDEVLSRALQNDLRLKAAFERLHKEEALYRGSLKEFLPKLSADGFGAFASGDKHFVSFFDAGITQPLFQGGKAVFEKNRQRTVLETEKIKLAETKLDLELSLRVLYAEVLLEKELTRLSQEKAKEISGETKKAKTLVEKSILSKQELFKIENLLEETRSALISHKESYDYLLTVLKDAAGIASGESLELEPWNHIPLLQENFSYYLNLSKEQNPVYKLKDLFIRQKEYEKRMLQAERFPELDLVAKYNRFDDVYLDTNRVLAGIEGRWNIWDFGRLGLKIKAKSHEIEGQKLEGELLLKEHEQEILKIFHESRAALGKIHSSDTLVLEREELYKNEKTKLIAGEKASFDLLESYAALQEAKTNRLKAISDYRILLSRLARKTSFEILKNPVLESRSGEKT